MLSCWGLPVAGAPTTANNGADVVPVALVKVTCTPLDVVAGNRPESTLAAVPMLLANTVKMDPGDAVPGAANDPLFTTDETPAIGRVTGLVICGAATLVEVTPSRLITTFCVPWSPLGTAKFTW